MTLAASSRAVGVDALAAYRERLDVRTPSEYAEDHLPGATNHPVLSDAERAVVGTVHAQESAFAAKRMGAALVARNIAHMLENEFAARPRDWAPLVYCWRGGKRSSSLVHILNEIGWRAVQLAGGYRAYRKQVRERLDTLPRTLALTVVCGLTGSGKSRLLEALAAEGAQVLDLERLAAHRGSLLGDLPTLPQPSQKRFETLVLEVMERFDPAQPVFVESESKRIGRLQVPEVLLDTMRSAPCLRIETPMARRIALLREDYAHFLADTDTLARRLAPLVALHGHATIDRWNSLAAAGEWDALVAELLVHHYDPTYTRSIDRNFPRHVESAVVTVDDIAAPALRTAARSVIERSAVPA